MQDVLRMDSHFLQGLQSGEDDLTALLYELSEHAGNLGMSAVKCKQLLAANLRQTLLMTLVPAGAFDASFSGSIDRAVSDHLATLGVTLSASQRQQLRDICINIRRLRHLSGTAARRASKSLGDLRAMPSTFTRIMSEQNQRCIWCGVLLASPNVKMSLEHMAPKHIGDDPNDGRNWAVACTTCNSGKGDLLSWASSPFANGYLRAKHFVNPRVVCIENRWIVLARDGRCDTCQQGPKSVELGIYRQISSGLPIPQHCAATCASCAATNGKEILTVDWDSQESARTF